MSNIGERFTPNDAANLRRRTRPARLPSDTMDAIAEERGWAVVRDCDERGYPRSSYTRGPWVLRVGWTERDAHAVRADLTNEVTRDHRAPSREKWIDPNTKQLSVVRRSQDVFRWVGHRLYDERLR